MRVKWALGKRRLYLMDKLMPNFYGREGGGDSIKVDITAHSGVVYVYGRETKLKLVAQWMLIKYS